MKVCLFKTDDEIKAQLLDQIMYMNFYGFNASNAHFKNFHILLYTIRIDFQVNK